MPSAKAYKTCHLWRISRTTLQKGTQKEWKALGLEGYCVALSHFHITHKKALKIGRFAAKKKTCLKIKFRCLAASLLP